MLGRRLDGGTLHRGLLPWIVVAVALGLVSAGVTRSCVRARADGRARARSGMTPVSNTRAPDPIRSTRPSVVSVDDAGAPSASPAVASLVPLVPLAPLPQGDARDVRLRERLRAQATPDANTRAPLPLADTGQPDAGAPDTGPRDAGSPPSSARPLTAPAMDAVPAAPVRVVVRDDNGAWLKLTSVEVTVNARALVSRASPNGLIISRDGVEMWTGTLFPGSHRIKAQLIYKGSGGLFGYLEGYTLKVTDTRTITVADGVPTTVDVHGTDRGATYPFEERPRVAVTTR